MERRNRFVKKEQFQKPARPAGGPKRSKPKTSSWGGVAKWYDDYLENNSDNYQEQVIAPNLLRVLSLQKGEQVLDVACGQGFFSRKFAEAGAEVTGIDISSELIEAAQKRSSHISYYATPAHKLSFAENGSFDTAVIVLAIQNIENVHEVFAEIKRVLVPGGRLVLVLNHPVFRIPKRSSWGYDEKAGAQYRRVDSYLSQSTTPIIMHPGDAKSESTVSYHRSMQDFFKAFNKYNFAVTRLEEWISHRESQKGPRQKTEDTARKEIPLFMMLEARKQ
jgi:ubiquinone/menaquinone biosynthesis C-methylase UbiE